MTTVCSDPEWASYTLGVFVCQSCSGLHRNIARISKVKSILLDPWSSSEVEVSTTPLCSRAPQTQSQQQETSHFWKWACCGWSVACLRVRLLCELVLMVSVRKSYDICHKDRSQKSCLSGYLLCPNVINSLPACVNMLSVSLVLGLHFSHTNAESTQEYTQTLSVLSVAVHGLGREQCL